MSTASPGLSTGRVQAAPAVTDRSGRPWPSPRPFGSRARPPFGPDASMLIIAVSLAVGLLGVLATRASLVRLVEREAGTDPHLPWALGFVGLLPAWLITFVALLGSSPAPRLPVWSAAAWITSSSAALVGAIVTEALVRRASESVGRPPSTYWAYGLAALLPAWLISILGNVVR